MAVYTHLGAEDLARLIAQYDVGELVSAKGIAEGVSNSNWLVETTGSAGGSSTSGTRFILTLYERRIDYADLPYFLDLLDHLAAKGCPVPRTMHDREGASFRMEQGKAAALIEFLPGVSPTRPTPQQARAVGAVLAELHLAARDFPLKRANAMDFAATAAILGACGEERLATIHPDLPAMLGHARSAAALDLAALPQSQLLGTSSFYASDPLGPADQPRYVNAVAALDTELQPWQLLDALQRIEQEQGRVRKAERWGPRTLDLDILLFGERLIDDERLTVPHYHMHARAFVLYPLAEIAPDLKLPDGRALIELLGACPYAGLERLSETALT